MDEFSNKASGGRLALVRPLIGTALGGLGGALLMVAAYGDKGADGYAVVGSFFGAVIGCLSALLYGRKE